MCADWGFDMMARISSRLFAASAALCIASTAGAQVLYTQAYDGSGNLQASQDDTGGGNGNFATVYDDFTLGSAATITGVSFTGGYFNPPTQGMITAFTVQFYSDAAGQPGSSIYSVFVPGDGGESCGGGVICTYDLATSFTAAAGVQYWLSIVPDIAFPPQWGWAFGTGGDATAYQDFFGTRSQIGTDFAFTLTGAGVPEPATWAMMLIGFGAIGYSMRRRRGAREVQAAA